MNPPILESYEATYAGNGYVRVRLVWMFRGEEREQTLLIHTRDLAGLAYASPGTLVSGGRGV